MLSLRTPKQNNSRRKTLSANDNETPVVSKMRTRRSVYASTPVSEAAKTPSTPALSRIDDEPAKAKAATPVSKILDPVKDRIQRDLNSPSATARVRAMRALKSPGYRKATYEIFDVPHEEQDIITEEERRPYRPKTIPEIFANCRIYVEVRTLDDNRSAGIKNKLLADGIAVNEKLYKDTTHVVFKDGLLSSYSKAKQLGIPVTSILWIEECKSQRRLVDPAKFPIYNAERYDNPEIYGRVRRQKSSQPEISKIVNYNSKPAAAAEPATKNFLDDESFTNITINTLLEYDNEKTIKANAAMDITGKERDEGDATIAEMSLQPEMTSMTPVNSRRLTTFTPRPMEQTKCEVAAAWKSVERRKTVFGSQMEETCTGSPFPASQTPNGGSFNAAKALFFNSANRIASTGRRSILDISMNILDLNCKAINAQAKENLNVRETDGDDVTSIPSDTAEVSLSTSSASIKTTQKPTENVVRKRKLFTNVSPDELNESKENFAVGKQDSSKKPKTSARKENERPVAKVNEDRRKTISYFKPSKPIEAVKTTKTSSSTKYVVCTNMSAEDKQKAQTAIQKLGGVLENAVSEKTTHVITPTVERTMNLLRGIIRACYILKFEWLIDSGKAGKWLDTTIYHHDICNTQKIYERMILGRNFKNLMFSHYGPFFINKEAIDNPKKVEYLKEIIERCSGALTCSKHDAKIIVSDRPIPLYPSVRRPTVVQSTYIFDAAMQSKMLPTAKYVPKTTH